MTTGIRNVSMVLGGRLGALSTGVLTQSLLAWSLGPADRGSLAVCLLFPALLVMVFSVGCDYGATYYVASRKFSISEGLFYSTVYCVISSVAAMAIGLWLIDRPIAFFSQATREAFRLSLWLVPVLLFSGIIERLLTAVELFTHYSMVVIVRSVLQLSTTIVFLLGFGWGVEGALAASIVTGVVTTVVCLWIFAAKCRLAWVRPSLGKFRRMLSYGLRYYSGKIGNAANVQIGTLALAFFATPVEIGWFAVAARLTKLVEMIPEAVTTVLLPRVAGDRHGSKDLVCRVARLVHVISIGVLLAMAALATPVVGILFSPDFLPAVPLIRILAIGTAAFCTGKVFLSYLIGTKHPGVASLAVGAGAAVNVALIWWLLPAWGISAAAWATTANYVVASCLLALAFRFFSGVPLAEVFRFRVADWSVFGPRRPPASLTSR